MVWPGRTSFCEELILMASSGRRDGQCSQASATCKTAPSGDETAPMAPFELPRRPPGAISFSDDLPWIFRSFTNARLCNFARSCAQSALRVIFSVSNSRLCYLHAHLCRRLPVLLSAKHWQGSSASVGLPLSLRPPGPLAVGPPGYRRTVALLKADMAAIGRARLDIGGGIVGPLASIAS